MVEILKTCIPIVVGALIAIIPTMVDKAFERKNDKTERQQQMKQELYVELISLFNKVLKRQCEGDDLDLLRNHINLISIIGSVEVVKNLNEYIDTWGESTAEVQSEKYCNLIKAMRVDVGIDKTINDEFPLIGLRDINVKNSKV